ncbi:MAG: alcohol dehydrogenase catalytic domain-containing protein [Nitriliruptorales bacterium]|nr:alcohol dehydrogenase catalytic domain-containing protein [Nitriliruptorales bacterium]
MSSGSARASRTRRSGRSPTPPTCSPWSDRSCSPRPSPGFWPARRRAVARGWWPMAETGELTVLGGPGEVEVASYPVPSPGPGEMVARMVRANICGSDLHIVRGAHPMVKPGFTLGHEGVGRVHALGEGVELDSGGAAVAVGDLVAATYFQTCGECPACVNEQSNICYRAAGAYARPAAEPPHFHGTIATHWHIGRAQSFFRVPDGVDERAAAGANCALAQVVHAAELSELAPGDTVLFQGAGGLGLCGVAVAGIRGAYPIIADLDHERLEASRAFGAKAALDFAGRSLDERVQAVREVTGGLGADVVVEVTGVASAFEEALRFVRPGGTIVTVGNITPSTAAIDPGGFTRAGGRLLAAYRYRPRHLATALRILERHPQIPWGSLVDADYSIRDVGDAIADSVARKITRASIVF